MSSPNPRGANAPLAGNTERMQSSAHLESNRGSVYMGGGQCGGSPGLLGGTLRPPFLR